MNLHEALKALEFDYELPDDDVVMDALVLMRVGKVDGSETTLLYAYSEGTDSVTVMGLASGAHELIAGRWRRAGRSDE